MSEVIEAPGLDVRIYNNRQIMGEAAAELVSEKIREILEVQDYVNIIFASAPSQNEFLATLATKRDIEWQRVNAFHMDEYLGLPGNAPQNFGNFLKLSLFSKLPFHSVNYIDGNAKDIQDEISRYTGLLKRYPVDIVCMGIGENGHIAFNDPHVADFEDDALVKLVDLDMASRMQQVNDKCFEFLSHVPPSAITLTIPALMKARFVYCIVPGKAKANAVFNTLRKEISEIHPSTIIRNHMGAILFLDKESSTFL
ncbi:6-phosphogluconolactonase [Flavitalea sp.]|nr:6-phosphogluconolactonase [Flavitalea sp.]